MNIKQAQTHTVNTHSIYQTTQTAEEKWEKNSPLKEHVTISKESLAKFTASIKLHDASEDDLLLQNFRKSIEKYNSPEAVEQRRLEQLEKEQSFNRLTDEFSLKGITYHFPENTLHHTIAEAMEGKVVNASLYAAELADSIRSSVSMPDKSDEERAAYREMALKQAEYVAENYFDNDEERTAFMDEVNRYYENDLLREKGYVVFDNSDLEPFKQYSSPRDNGKVSYMTLAKEFMDADSFERWLNNENTKEESDKFIRQLVNNSGKWSNEIIEKHELNVQQTEKAITDVKEMFESFVWEDGRIITTGEEQHDFLDELIKWNENMLNLFY